MEAGLKRGEIWTASGGPDYDDITRLNRALMMHLGLPG
jgi:hypothetical protein